jgi:flagellin FlaB
MKDKMKMLLRDESGITALETAIILIAFVVVAAVFAFTILSAGAFSTEQSREAIYSGLEEVQGSLELKGSVIATSTNTGTTGTVDSVVFTVANVAGGEPVDISSSGPLILEYRDSENRYSGSDVSWSLSWPYRTDSDDLLEERELAELAVTIPATASLSTDTGFVVEVKPPNGSPLYLQRTTPSVIDEVMDLH